MSRRQWMRVSHRPILTVDDDPDCLFVFARLLLKADVGLRLRTAPGGREAIVQLERMMGAEEIPLIAFIDARMPSLDGIGLLQWIRGRAKLSRVPVVILSEAPSASDIEQAGLLGAQAFLQKALTQPQVGEILEYALDCETRAAALKPIDCPGNLIAE